MQLNRAANENDAHFLHYAKELAVTEPNKAYLRLFRLPWSCRRGIDVLQNLPLAAMAN